eukprot:gnl/Dysnectes_brevis/1896_a2178_2192.p1 GENE.gnl/Dysnectes_brevis/1896_a2178_2192~~gnl/Dysnectes_brevis/1896_a2178_2192.p1  ORF type:complete len:360 (+),score=105.44 gnl/Dysnectes_brevis/1896_a2178_2192:27-1082(+)
MVSHDDEKMSSAHILKTGIYAFMFLVFYSSQSILVKYNDNVLDISYPWLSAVFLTGGWPVNIFTLAYGRWQEGTYKKPDFRVPDILKRMFRRYTFLGILDGIHIALLSVGLNALPGSVYMILKSSSLPFNLILSRIMIGKKFTTFNVLAVCLVTVGICIIGFEPDENGVALMSSDTTIPFICSLTSAFIDALQTCFAQILFEDARIPKSERSFESTAETAFYNGFVSFCLVLPIPWISGEYKTWDIEDNLYWIVSIGVALSKQLGYLFKFGTTSLSSALLVGVVDMVRRLVVILLCIWLYDESWTVYKLWSIICVFAGFSVYVYGGWSKNKASAPPRDSDREHLLAPDEEL